MFKNKIPSLLIFALVITSMSWALLAYESYTDQDTALGVMYTILFLFTFGLGIVSSISNHSLNKK